MPKLPDNPLETFPSFFRRVARRLRRGQEDYGDVSFELAPLELVQQIREEVEDIVGWAFVLDARLARFENLLARLEQLEKETKE